jgi:hypothetical protein
MHSSNEFSAYMLNFMWDFIANFVQFLFSIPSFNQVWNINQLNDVNITVCRFNVLLSAFMQLSIQGYLRC